MRKLLLALILAIVGIFLNAVLMPVLHPEVEAAYEPPSPTASPSPEPTNVTLPSVDLEETAGFEDDRAERIRGLEPGDVVAHLTVPRIGMQSYPVRFGIGLDVLAVGPGVYPGAAEPGDGNFSLAGHRVTPVGPWDHGPFRYINTLRHGDRAKVLYKGKTYTYAFVRTLIINPLNTHVLQDHRADMTFTACHPPGSATERIVAQWRLLNG